MNHEELFGWILLANLMVLVVLITIFLFTDRAHKMVVRSLLFVIFKAYKRGVYFPPFDAAIVEQAVRFLGGARPPARDRREQAK